MQIAELTKDHPALYGYGLMNEPKGPHAAWAIPAQSCVDAIRAVDKITAIVIGGSSWSSASRWISKTRYSR